MKLLGWLLGMLMFSQGMIAQQLEISYAGDELPAKEKEWIECFLAEEVAFYVRLGLKDTTCLQLTVFDKKQAALYYLDSIQVALPSLNVSGLYIPRRKEVVILGREKWRERSSKIIVHELAHHLTRRTIQRVPGWLNEGLSEYWEHCEWGKKGLKHTLGDYERGRLRTMYMLGEVDLKSFVDNADGSFRKKLHTDESYAYILSHALVTFVLEKAEADYLAKLVALLNQQKAGARSSLLIETTYPGGFAQFEQDFARFCHQD